MPRPSALVVCLGNICRSPMGEAVLKHVAVERGIDLVVESAGTADYHVGEEPDERTTEICRRHKIHISHDARTVSEDDFRNFTYILACDEANLRNLIRVKPDDATAEVRLWGSYADNKTIGDPYYGGIDGFESVFRQCLVYSHLFLDKVFGKAGPQEKAETDETKASL